MKPIPRTLTHLSWRRLAALLAGLVIVGAGWFFLAPPGLGGSTAYVVTDGVSMQPRFHTGDLALVRPASTYRVGDIAAYHSHRLHIVVLHRIVATSGGRYIFKGDANSWRDPERVTRAQLVGKLWVMAPGLGGRLNELRSPAAMAILVGSAIILLFGGAGARAHRRRRRRGPEPKWKPKPVQASPQMRRGLGGSYGGIVVALLALVVFAGVTALAWTAPTRRSVPTVTSYQQSGSFSYSARTVTGAVYDTGVATTGQPMFLRLIGPVDVRFAYALRSGVAARAGGTASLDAVVASPSGWRRTIPLEGPTPFRGTHVAVAGTLHLRRLERLLQRVGAATAVPDGTFTLTLVPTVHTRGTLAGHRFQAGYAPQLPFTLSPVELAPVLPAAAPGAVPSPAAAAATFHRLSGGTVTSVNPTSAHIGPARLRVPVAIARIIALLGLAASLAALHAAAVLFRRARLADEPTRIKARYGESIITAVHSTLGRHGDFVQVKSMEALALLAARYESLIIHEHTDLGHAYLVADNGTVYAYLVHPQGSERELREMLTAESAPSRVTPPATARGVARTIPA